MAGKHVLKAHFGSPSFVAVNQVFGLFRACFCCLLLLLLMLWFISVAVCLCVCLSVCVIVLELVCLLFHLLLSFHSLFLPSWLSLSLICLCLFVALFCCPFVNFPFFVVMCVLFVVFLGLLVFVWVSLKKFAFGPPDLTQPSVYLFCFCCVFYWLVVFGRFRVRWGPKGPSSPSSFF